MLGLVTTGGVGSDVVCGVPVGVCDGDYVGTLTGVACFVIATCAAGATAVGDDDGTWCCCLYLC